MKPRICLFCKHFNIDFGSGDWSEYTPGQPPSLECRKNVWNVYARDLSREAYRKLQLTAEKCPFFEEGEK